MSRKVRMCGDHSVTSLYDVRAAMAALYCVCVSWWNAALFIVSLLNHNWAAARLLLYQHNDQKICEMSINIKNLISCQEAELSIFSSSGAIIKYEPAPDLKVRKYVFVIWVNGLLKDPKYVRPDFPMEPHGSPKIPKCPPSSFLLFWNSASQITVLGLLYDIGYLFYCQQIS